MSHLYIIWIYWELILTIHLDTLEFTYLDLRIDTAPCGFVGATLPEPLCIASLLGGIFFALGLWPMFREIRIGLFMQLVATYTVALICWGRTKNRNITFNLCKFRNMEWEDQDLASKAENWQKWYPNNGKAIERKHQKFAYVVEDLEIIRHTKWKSSWTYSKQRSAWTHFKRTPNSRNEKPQIRVGFFTKQTNYYSKTPIACHSEQLKLANFRHRSHNVMVINPDSDPVTPEICGHSWSFSEGPSPDHPRVLSHDNCYGSLSIDTH